MMEEYLISYGVLGIWTITLLVDKFRHQKEMRAVIQNNTEALIRVYDVLGRRRR
jgi:hypothetical protein